MSDSSEKQDCVLHRRVGQSILIGDTRMDVVEIVEDSVILHFRHLKPQVNRVETLSYKLRVGEVYPLLSPEASIHLLRIRSNDNSLIGHFRFLLSREIPLGRLEIYEAITENGES